MGAPALCQSGAHADRLDITLPNPRNNAIRKFIELSLFLRHLSTHSPESLFVLSDLKVDRSHDVGGEVLRGVVLHEGQHQHCASSTVFQRRWNAKRGGHPLAGLAPP